MFFVSFLAQLLKCHNYFVHFHYVEFNFVYKDKEHDAACNGGVARMSIKTGDIRR